MGKLLGGYEFFPDGYCPSELTGVCDPGANPACFKYESFCAKKLKRLWYQRCRVLPESPHKECAEWDHKCFLAAKYETLPGGLCNAGQPAPCTEDYLGQWYIGAPMSVCSYAYVDI